MITPELKVAAAAILEKAFKGGDVMAHIVQAAVAILQTP